MTTDTMALFPVAFAASDTNQPIDNNAPDNTDPTDPASLEEANSSICTDTDGDGWGWDGTSTCVINSSPSEQLCEDTDGDGWGGTVQRLVWLIQLQRLSRVSILTVTAGDGTALRPAWSGQLTIPIYASTQMATAGDGMAPPAVDWIKHLQRNPL